ncbi:hypothetical protein AMD24_00770 [Candidatus Xiphinematobacter sp. Idaho Grape]|nr:hypothetical protein AMD24_00770 [Candidatus Xiphinematobacter sp. Idaho Grape]
MFCVDSNYLLHIVRCPKSGQPLREAGALELEELNLRVCSGTLLNQLGQTVCQPLKAALIREDGNVAYPVRDDIPFLLLEEAITI